MNYYPYVVAIHLLCALVFIGAVFFEVLILDPAMQHVPKDARRDVQQAIALRARNVVPWVLLVLYGTGGVLAYVYWGFISHPLASRFGFLLTIKIILALSVFGHFVRAMTWRGKGRLSVRRFQLLHLSLFFHMLGIVLIAKFMFHVG